MASLGAKITVANAIGFASLHEVGAASSAKVLSSPAAMAPASMEQTSATTKSHDAMALESAQDPMQLEQTRSEVKAVPQTHERRGTGIMIGQESRLERWRPGPCR